jgi:hypothetical protein
VQRQPRAHRPRQRVAVQVTSERSESGAQAAFRALQEGFFSKFARSVLHHIRVASKHELTERIMAGIDDVNRHLVIHTWSYKLAEVA